jgi:hypothetical protein
LKDTCYDHAYPLYCQCIDIEKKYKAKAEKEGICEPVLSHVIKMDGLLTNQQAAQSKTGEVIDGNGIDISDIILRNQSEQNSQQNIA